MISVVCSNRLTILPAELLTPWMIRARVWLTTCCTLHALQGRLLQHVSGSLDALDDLLREAFGLRHHLSGRAQQFAIALLQLFLNLRSTPAACPSDLD